MSKRNIFSEVMEGFDALENEREGKVTLKTTVSEHRPLPEVSAEEVRQLRARLKMSQPAFARQLRIEERTVADWEQGLSRPDAHATILLRLVERHPELLQEIAAM